MTETVKIVWQINTEDDERIEVDFDSKKEAYNYAEEEFYKYCDEQEGKNNEILSTTVELIMCFFNEDKEEYVDLKTEEWDIEYEFYHGDYEEHFNQGAYV